MISSLSSLGFTVSCMSVIFFCIYLGILLFVVVNNVILNDI